MRITRAPGVVVVVSDFRDEGWVPALRAAAAHHTVVAVEVTDPAEGELPAVGALALVDPETGQLVEADTSSPVLRAAYAQAEADRRARVHTAIRRAGARHLPLSTDRDWLRDLGKGLR